MRWALGTTFFIAAATTLSAHAEISGIRHVGRVAEANRTLELHWAGSGFETIVNGSKLEAIIEDTGENFLSIEVDGKSFVLDLDPGRFAYTLFRGEAGTHTVRVTRRNSPLAPATRVSAIKTDGKLAAPAAPTRRMMVIGDSIGAGFGVEGQGPECAFSYATQNQNRAYGALTAKAFGAELYNLSVDGRGLVRNWDNAPTPTLKDLYTRTTPNSPRVWPAKNNPVDLVVVQVGANDFANNQPGASFTKAYSALLADLRASYPNALVVAATGPSLNGEERAIWVSAVRGVVDERTKAGDTNLRFVDFQLAPTGRVWGCQWHPGIDTQAAMAQTLQKLTQEVLKW